MKKFNQSEYVKLEASCENKIKVLDVKIAQMSLTNGELKDKKNSLEQSYMIEKK